MGIEQEINKKYTCKYSPPLDLIISCLRFCQVNYVVSIMYEKKVTSLRQLIG